MTERRLVVHGEPAVCQHRPGLGMPLLLVPGCGRDHHAFDALLPELYGREVVVACLPGRGGSGGTAPASAAEAAAFVAALVEALGTGPVIAGGHSYGGAVAIELALSRPDLVAGLVLLHTGARLRVHPDILEGAEAAAANPAYAANLADWRACHAFDRMRDVATLRVPTLVLTGADDPLTPPRYAEFLGQQIAGARVVIVPGAGHEAPSTHARGVAGGIEGVLGGHR